MLPLRPLPRMDMVLGEAADKSRAGSLIVVERLILTVKSKEYHKMGHGDSELRVRNVPDGLEHIPCSLVCDCYNHRNR